MANATNDVKKLPPCAYKLFREAVDHTLYIWGLLTELERLLGKEARYGDIEAYAVGCDSGEDIDNSTIDEIIAEWPLME